jgi:hypothetical protein
MPILRLLPDRGGRPLYCTSAAPDEASGSPATRGRLISCFQPEQAVMIEREVGRDELDWR